MQELQNEKEEYAYVDIVQIKTFYSEGEVNQWLKENHDYEDIKVSFSLTKNQEMYLVQYTETVYMKLNERILKKRKKLDEE